MSVLITTSREPCKRTSALAKELEESIPDSLYLRRGRSTVEKMVERAQQKGFTRILVITECHGNPKKLVFIRVREKTWQWIPETIMLKAIKLRKDFKKQKIKVKSLKIKDKLKLKSFLDIESEDSDYILQSDKQKITFYKEKQEIGPLMKVSEVRKDEV
jgi:rRNA maturation protein Rpf1